MRYPVITKLVKPSDEFVKRRQNDTFIIDPQVPISSLIHYIFAWFNLRKK